MIQLLLTIPTDPLPKVSPLKTCMPFLSFLFQFLEEDRSVDLDNMNQGENCYQNMFQLPSKYYVGRTESHEQLFFARSLGTADEREYGGRWNQLLY
jgi:hypothetical protein